MTTVAPASTEKVLERQPRSPTQDALRALFRTKSAIIGMVVLLILVIVAMAAPVIAPYDPNRVLIGVEPIKMRSGPCIHLLGCPADRPQHLLGVDGNVRDFFSRIVYGSRVSLMIGFTTVGLPSSSALSWVQLRGTSEASRTTSSCASWTFFWPSRHCCWQSPSSPCWAKG